MPRIALIAAIALAPLAARAEQITVTASECDHVVAHTPDASVAYKPGVTADGRAVAPANLSGGSFTVEPPEKITIDINLDLQERFGLPANKGQYMGEAKIGEVVIENGRATYNGQPLATGAQHAIAEACRKLKAKR